MTNGEGTRTTRVFLVLPAIPREIVLGLLDGAPDIVVLGTVGDLSELHAVIDTARSADVLLVSGGGSAASMAFDLMGLPDVPAVMAIDATGPSIELHEVSPRARPLGNLAPGEFIAEIRSATAREEVPWP